MGETAPAITTHGARQLPAVTVEAYNAELRDGEGFLGDRASSSAFHAILDEWRERLRAMGEDPFGDASTAEIGKRKLDKVLVDGEPEAAGAVQSAIEDFAGELAAVAARFLKLKGWRDVARIAVGGGVRARRVGEIAIGRAALLLHRDGIGVELKPIHHDPDEAGLIGAVHLVPAWIFSGHDAILAVDVGGSKIRAGIVTLHGRKSTALPEGAVHESETWRHADERPTPGRGDVVKRIGKMLGRLAQRAKKDDLDLAPFVGVACPGVIAADGSIERGGQNLPGNWESTRFNLPAEIRAQLPTIGDHETLVVMHNDAVVQGLSELPYMQDVAHWGVLTIGTGLGNAAFTNRAADG